MDLIALIPNNSMFSNEIIAKCLIHVPVVTRFFGCEILNTLENQCSVLKCLLIMR